ncbi:MAG: glycosyltransferase family 2 protein [Candidatus Omnitrophota bacterium]|nr:glycosyltransferase family 2 protein [Candidatus Omnitrophota bacterium]MBU1928244.1 glycosyltransferase family 2 protein [Candidatus Omnitrophota bacterium]MBU2034418.1 glycosyltransferase family 2 protein [Candidatus Omnitrophota bacterium]MBU2221639.1 glycosyltransferase family 2 protein [Candidatus Omnitrophota bacterium]
MSSQKIKRCLEIIPGALSWSSIAFLVILAILRPVSCAILIIIFDFYWIIRTVYLTTLLILAHRKLMKEKNKRWLSACQHLSPDKKWEEIYHLIIFPVYKEGLEILRPSLEALKKCRYPRENMVVVMAFEERFPKARENAQILEREFAGEFFEYLSTFHPDGLSNEKRIKGANATWAAKLARELLGRKNIPYDKVIISCFDADTCVEKEYFGCLSYHFLTSPKPHQSSYQPIPVYNNNIWYAPSFARIVEISASFCQMIESMRLEKFVTFSSHSMSFKTLVDIDYWPKNMISDDSVVYWKAFIFYNGDYRVIPLYTTVSMDIAYSSSFLKTILIQYKQKKRWAWGVENFPYVAIRFLHNRQIPFIIKIKRMFHLLESHVTWAVWAIIIVVIAPLPILLGGWFFRQMPIGYNLPLITGLLLNFTLVTSFIWIILSRLTLPPRPKDISWMKNVVMLLEWVIVPFIILILGSTPALDAQTQLMSGRELEFCTTEKMRKVV